MNTTITAKDLESPESLKLFLDGVSPEDVKANGYLKFNFPAEFSYEYLSISFTDCGGPSQREVGFYWTLARNFKVMRMSGYYHPAKGDYVQTFRGIRGAVRSIVRHLGYAIEKFNERKA